MSYTKINSELCIANSYVRSECTKCQQICPRQAILDNNINDELCDDCGICLVECPVNAVQSLIPYQSDLEKIANNDNVVLQCLKSHGESSFPCLGFLDGRMVFAIAQKHFLTIDVEGCSSCNEVVYERLKKIIGACNVLLKDQGKSIVDTAYLEHGVATVASKKVNRSAFFKYFIAEAFQTVGNILADTTKTYQKYAPEDYIKKQLQDVETQGIEEKMFFSMTIADSCNACGLCAKICPRKAISAKVQEQSMLLAYDPTYCYNCGICAEKCPQAAVHIVEDWSWCVKEHKVKLPFCDKCNKAFQPINNSSSCYPCVNEERNKEYR